MSTIKPEVATHQSGVVWLDGSSVYTYHCGPVRDSHPLLEVYDIGSHTSHQAKSELYIGQTPICWSWYRLGPAGRNTHVQFSPPQNINYDVTRQDNLRSGPSPTHQAFSPPYHSQPDNLLVTLSIRAIPATANPQHSKPVAQRGYP